MKCIKCNNWYSSLFKDYSFIYYMLFRCELWDSDVVLVFCSVLFSLFFFPLYSLFPSILKFFSIFYSLYFLPSSIFFSPFLFLNYLKKKPSVFGFPSFDFSAVDKVSIDVEFSEDEESGPDKFPIRNLYGISCRTCYSLMVVTTVWMVAIVGIVRNVYVG